MNNFFIITINACWCWLFICLCFVFYIFFLQIAENNKFKKKASRTKFCNFISLLLLKVGLVIPVEQQINFVLPQVFPLKFIWDHFYIIIIHKIFFFNWNITSSPYLEMLKVKVIKLLFLFLLGDCNIHCCFL